MRSFNVPAQLVLYIHSVVPSFRSKDIGTKALNSLTLDGELNVLINSIGNSARYNVLKNYWDFIFNFTLFVVYFTPIDSQSAIMIILWEYR